MNRLTLAAALAFVTAAPAFAADPPAADTVVFAKKVVTQCVGVVRQMTPSNALLKEYYTSFDAFYNPSNGQVENNATVQGRVEPLFYFNKCMAETGMPLTYK